jgi:hypothetical protein
MNGIDKPREERINGTHEKEAEAEGDDKEVEEQVEEKAEEVPKAEEGEKKRKKPGRKPKQPQDLQAAVPNGRANLFQVGAAESTLILSFDTLSPPRRSAKAS